LRAIGFKRIDFTRYSVAVIGLFAFKGVADF